MPDDRTLPQGPNPAPAAIDDRLDRLLAGLDELKIAIPKIPSYEAADIHDWATLRDTYWRPPLQKLNDLCHACADLYPVANVTQHPTYEYLRRLLEDNLCTTSFRVDLFQTTSAFETFKGRFGSIPDEDVWFKFFQVIAKLKTAYEHFSQEVKSAHQAQLRP